MKNILLTALILSASVTIAATQDDSTTPVRGARYQPGADMVMYSPQQHAMYDGRFVITGRNLFQVGSLDDKSPWDHMDNEAQHLKPVVGEIHIDVNEIDNEGEFWAEIELDEGLYRVEMKRFHEFSPCQDGGIAAYLFEHGNAGCGDSNWPKSLLFVAGWGYGSATLNGEPLYEDYEIHFMVTQGMRNRETLKVLLSPETGEAGAINPAAQQVDFFIRSPARNENNHPGREIFDHFFGMEVTWH